MMMKRKLRYKFWIMCYCQSFIFSIHLYFQNISDVTIRKIVFVAETSIQNDADDFLAMSLKTPYSVVTAQHSRAIVLIWLIILIDVTNIMWY